VPSVIRRPNPVFSEEYRVLREVIVEARKASGLSQRALGAALGKSGSHICMIERGQRQVDALELYRIAKVLDRDPAGLFDLICQRVDALAAGTNPR
jgi:transcriptional regulator with XRE-family HTH domain